MEDKVPEWIVEFKDVTDIRVLSDRIRQFTMKYSKDKAFRRKQDLLRIKALLRQVEETLVSDPSVSNLETLVKLKNK